MEINNSYKKDYNKSYCQYSYQKDYSKINKDFLQKSSYLSEFRSKEEKEQARRNLGIVGTGKDFKYEDFTPEQLALLKGEKGDDGTVAFDELTDRQLNRLIAMTIVEQHLDPGSYNAIASRVVYELYQNLLNSFKVNQDTVDNLLNSNIETIRQAPILFVTEDEYKSLVDSGTYNPRAIYAITEETVVVPTEGWKFGDQFPIVFGNISKGFKFGDAFPIIFN